MGGDSQQGPTASIGADDERPRRIAMWSGPRNISTALMRSWDSRADTYVTDEPLYAHYLASTGADHPAREQILEAQSPDWRRVVDWLTGPIPEGRTIWYQKHMGHHLTPEVEHDWILELTNCFLIREPREMITSYIKIVPEPTPHDLALPQQVELFERIERETGTAPPVIDSRDVLEDPERILTLLCDALGLTFDRAMLAWEPGLRPTDGVWAPHWYDSVARTTTFGPNRARTRNLRPSSRRSAASATTTTNFSTAAASTEASPEDTPSMRQQFLPQNENLKVNINGRLVHRDEAGVSPFDSAVQGGDAVWEGLRLYGGRIFKLDEHLQRLESSAKALAFSDIPSAEAIKDEIRRTLEANDMHDGVHIRLTLTRGVKYTSGMDPRLNTAGPTLIVLAEFKPPVYDTTGIRLITSSVRRPAPDVLDPKIHHSNLIQSILAKIEANHAGADDA